MTTPVDVGRYRLYDVIASGGMAAVHLARIVGPGGFQRIFAIKRLHAHLATDPKFATMFLDEARVASRIHHPNVVGILDVAAQGDELFLVMDYVRGDSLAALLSDARDSGAPWPSVGVVSAIVSGILHGLHAAHEARDEDGRPMEIVHRDVSPHNILVGSDGIARVVDFGIAKAKSRVQTTNDGEVKGKLAYMAPEQLDRHAVDRRTDIYAAGVVLWEALARARLFTADSPGGVVTAVLQGNVAAPGIAPAVDGLVLRALARTPEARFPTALEMAETLAHVAPPATPGEVAAWVESVAGPRLAERAARLAQLERSSSPTDSAPELAAPLSVRLLEERRRLVDAATDVGALPEPEPAPVTEPDRGAKRRRLLLRIGAIPLIAVAVFAASRIHRTKVVTTAPPVESTVAITAPPITSAPTPAAEPPAPPPVIASAPRPVAAKTAAKPAPRPRPSSRPDDCNPAFTIDADGIKRFKRWCTTAP